MSSGRDAPVAKKAEAVRNMFASLARRYDLLNSLLSVGTDARWRRQAAAAATSSPGALILDLCTGTGRLAAELQRRFPEAGIVGLDFCTDMLSLARRSSVSSSSCGNGSLRLLCGDALHLPLRSSCFDLVAVAFGIRNFADLGGGLAEIRRCLKPGGSILTLEFFLPERGIFAGLYRFYLWRVLPLLGETISGVRGAYSYLRDSVEDFVTPEELSKLMADAGFHDVSHRLLTGGIVAIHQGRRAA